MQFTMKGETIMKTKEEYCVLNEKKNEPLVDTLDNLTDEELIQVIGGINQIDENALLTFNGKIPSDGSHNMSTKLTSTVLYSQSLDESTNATSRFTPLKTRTGEDLNI